MIPFVGMLPMWVLIVILGRELLVTLFRQWAVRQDVVIAAGTPGKYKTLLQNLFSGGLLLWYPLQEFATAAGASQPSIPGLRAGPFSLDRGDLALALILTIYSMVDYLWTYRALLGFRN